MAPYSHRPPTIAPNTTSPPLCSHHAPLIKPKLASHVTSYWQSQPIVWEQFARRQFVMFFFYQNGNDHWLCSWHTIKVHAKNYSSYEWKRTRCFPPAEIPPATLVRVFCHLLINNRLSSLHDHKSIRDRIQATFYIKYCNPSDAVKFGKMFINSRVSNSRRLFLRSYFFLPSNRFLFRLTLTSWNWTFQWLQWLLPFGS